MVKDNLKIASFALGAFVRDTAAEKAAVSRAGGLAFGDETECKILRGKTLVVEWSHQEVLAGMTTSRTKIEVALSACPCAVLNGKTVTVAIAGDVKVHSGVQPFDYAKRQRGKPGEGERRGGCKGNRCITPSLGPLGNVRDMLYRTLYLTRFRRQVGRACGQANGGGGSASVVHR